MSTTTTNHGLTKPAYTDAADIADLNANFDAIDDMPVLYRDSSEPSNKVSGKTLWQDTTNGLLKLWNGASWDIVAASSDHEHSYADIADMALGDMHIGPIEPSNPLGYQTWWYNDSQQRLFVYGASGWMLVSDVNHSHSYMDIDDGDVPLLVITPDMTLPLPTGVNERTFWYEKDGGKLMFRVNDVWVPVADPEAITRLFDDNTPMLSADLNALWFKIVNAEMKNYSETVKSHGTTGGSITCNLEDGNIHTITLNAATTFTFSNPPASGKAGSLTLIITQASTAVSVTWPASVEWVYGSAPDLSGDSTDYVLVFLTTDGGTTWRGWLSGSAFT